MRKIKFLSLLLVLALVLPMALASCGGNPTPGPGGDTTPGGNTSTEGWYKDLDFHNEDLIINISVAENTEQTFEPGDKYIKGPDAMGKDSVLNMVFNRNKKLTRELNLNVIYQETNESVGNVLPVIQDFVLVNAGDAPDIFNNDIYDTTHAMLVGYLWNVLDPTLGNETLDSYFNFESESWRWVYMQGATMDPSKVYLLVGDAFLDVMRYAFCLYVNMGLFNDTFANGGSAAWGDVIMLYSMVMDGEWDIDTLGYFVEMGFRDGDGDGLADEDDNVVGFVMSPLAERSFLWTSGLSIVQKGENNTYSIKEQNPEMFRFSEMFTYLYNQGGVLRTDLARDCNTFFMNGNVLFTLSMLGELESPQMADANFDKGIVPIPKYDMEKQDSYHTLVHDQTEIACILQTAQNFSGASAYLQLMMEESTPILQEYYEDTLKIRKNDHKETRDMIDNLYENIDLPFDSLIARQICSGAKLPANVEDENGNALTPTSGTEIYNFILKDAQDKSTSFVSSYDADLDRWKNNLKILVLQFKNMQ